MRAKMTAEKISAEKGREAGICEIAEILNISPSEIALSFEAVQPTESLYKTISDSDNHQILLLDKIYDSNENEDKILTTVALKSAIETLPEKERQILMLRYFKERTQSEVARIMGGEIVTEATLKAAAELIK